MREHPYRVDEEPAIAFGELAAGEATLPLRRIDLHARVAGIHAHVTLEQHFASDRGVALEVVYTFPAPALGAVSSYTFAIDGVATRRKLLEREQALRRGHRGGPGRVDARGGSARGDDGARRQPAARSRACGSGSTCCCRSPMAPRSCGCRWAGRCVLVGLPPAPPGTPLPALPVPLRGLGRYLA